MRKLSVVLAVVLAASALLLVPAVALANFGIHGGYTMDTHTCAGCHRAHTAASSITWTNAANDQRSALLLSAADELYEFCFTCHGSAAAGAATNVYDGVYEASEYGTLGDELNSGAFSDAVVGDNHHTYDGTSSKPHGSSEAVVMSCGSCHDVHGSSNYRLLKDGVNGVDVGGYIETASGDFLPDPYVISNEPGYPEDGWLLHDAGAAQIAEYEPNYTTPMYAKAPDEDPSKGISAWCAACHTKYHGSGPSSWNADDGFGNVMRYPHPVNVPLSNYKGARPLNISGLKLPVAQEFGEWTAAAGPPDWLDCLTCHQSHGSDSKMKGFADVADSTDPEPDSGNGSVPPSTTNSFLRLDNRGVCEACHNK
jgi:predicted CXXCH cytochrome family protein